MCARSLTIFRAQPLKKNLKKKVKVFRAKPLKKPFKKIFKKNFKKHFKEESESLILFLENFLSFITCTFSEDGGRWPSKHVRFMC